MTLKPKCIFLFFLDNEIHRLFGITRAYGEKNVFSKLMLATKMGLLLCEECVLIPVSNYFESDYSFRLLNGLYSRKAYDLGLIKLISSAYNLEELLQKKNEEHGDNVFSKGYHYKDYLYPRKKLILPGTLIKRSRSASLDIKSAWTSEKGISVLGTEVYNRFEGLYSASEIERIIQEVPDRLEKRAYISGYITPMFNPPSKGRQLLDNQINRFITTEYIRSFLDEYAAVCLKDIPLLESANIIIPEEYKHVSYKEYYYKLSRLIINKKRGTDFLVHASVDELIDFKNSPEYDMLFEDSRSKAGLIFPINKPYKSKVQLGVNDMENQATIGVLTALPKEYAAVKLLLNDTKEVFFNEAGNGERYLSGNLDSVDGRKHHIVLMQCGEGNNKAALRCAQMLKSFPNIQAVIMCGIAGGVPNLDKADEDVWLGDIVVANSVFQYDYGKKKGDAWESKVFPVPTSSSIQRAINKLRADEYEDQFAWHKYISDNKNEHFKKPSSDPSVLFDQNGNIVDRPSNPRRGDYPIVHYGCIGSANTVLKDADTRARLSNEHNIKAVEMEGSGIADAASDSMVSYIIIRGICDYCDEYKNDAWQEYAAFAAAAYTRCVIETMPAFK